MPTPHLRKQPLPTRQVVAIDPQLAQLLQAAVAAPVGRQRAVQAHAANVPARVAHRAGQVRSHAGVVGSSSSGSSRGDSGRQRQRHQQRQRQMWQDAPPSSPHMSSMLGVVFFMPHPGGRPPLILLTVGAGDAHMRVDGSEHMRVDCAAACLPYPTGIATACRRSCKPAVLQSPRQGRCTVELAAPQRLTGYVKDAQAREAHCSVFGGRHLASQLHEDPHSATRSGTKLSAAEHRRA